MVEIKTDKPIIVSKCLAGFRCNYKGESSPNETVMRLVNEGKAVPVCPEELGGLPTPRTPAEKLGERIITRDGEDVTEEFNIGAQKAFSVSQGVGAVIAILKARSPSCGKGLVYDGTYTKTLVAGNGITSELFIQNGIEVLTEEEL